ncbi:MAG TPA: MFS transporter [Bryobacteraceae bacterium]|nr:MFS transporter [Bryobacteraceae bacterium]
MRRSFYGKWIIAACLITFGISVGLPYYNMPFFYDYYRRIFNWPLHDITFGFPLAALLTLWVGPVLVPKLSPRKLIVAGTLLTFFSFFGFSRMTGSIAVYYSLWFLYTFGYILSGPIPHQIIVSQWFRRNRGIAMGIVYVGVGLVGAAGPWLIKPVTEQYSFRAALLTIGLVMFLAWPFALFLLKDRPVELGQFPDGDLQPTPDQKVEARSFGYLLRQWPFWLLLIGSLCSIGSIGAINQHMKLVFADQGFTDQKTLNETWSEATRWILWSSIAGRLLIGKFADIFPMKHVMTVTYFIVAASIPLLLSVHPTGNPYTFAIVFGFAMGADYMLIPLMAAKQFGVNSLARSMAVILPVNTIGQTWVPYGVAWLRENFGNYRVPMEVVLGVAIVGAISILLLPREASAVAETATPRAMVKT